MAARKRKAEEEPQEEEWDEKTQAELLAELKTMMARLNKRSRAELMSQLSQEDKKEEEEPELYYCADRITNPRCTRLTLKDKSASQIESLRTVQKWKTLQECEDSKQCTRLVLPTRIQYNVSSYQKQDEMGQLLASSIKAAGTAAGAGGGVVGGGGGGDAAVLQVLPSVFVIETLISLIQSLYNKQDEDSLHAIEAILKDNPSRMLMNGLLIHMENFHKTSNFSPLQLQFIERLLPLIGDKYYEQSKVILLGLIHEQVLRKLEPEWKIGEIGPELRTMLEMIESHTINHVQSLSSVVTDNPWYHLDALPSVIKYYKLIFTAILRAEREMLSDPDTQTHILLDLWPTGYCVTGKEDQMYDEAIRKYPNEELVRQFFLKIIRGSDKEDELKQLLRVIDENNRLYDLIIHSRDTEALEWMRQHPDTDLRCGLSFINVLAKQSDELENLRTLAFSKPWYKFTPEMLSRVRDSLLALNADEDEHKLDEVARLLAAPETTNLVYHDLVSTIESILAAECVSGNLDCHKLQRVLDSIPRRARPPPPPTPPSAAATTLPLLTSAAAPAPADLPGIGLMAGM